MQKMLNNRNHPIEFYPEEWENYLKAGCYPYSLNLKIDKFALIGDFIGKRCTKNTDEDTLIDTLQEEVRFLGFEIRQVRLREIIHLKNGEFLIYLIRDKHLGVYHVLRRDDNGTWSHKFPDEYPIKANFLEEEYVRSNNRFAKGWMFALKPKDS